MTLTRAPARGHATTLPAVVAFVLLLGVSAWPLKAQTLPTQTLSFDSRYLTETYSNQAVGEFAIEFMELVTLPAGQVSFSGKTGGIGSVLLLALGSGVVSGGISLAYHEFGHGTRSAAAGLKPFFAHGEDPSDEMLDEILASRDPMDNFFEFFLESLFERETGYTLTTTDRTLFPPLSLEELRDTGWHVNIRAGGLNNEMLLTQMIEEHSFRSRGNLGFLILYFTGKVAAWKAQYTADMTRILVGYSSLGFDFDESTIDLASLGSVALSGLSYQFLLELSKTLRGESIYFVPWSWRGVEVPNTSFFLTRSGLSYRVGSGYRRGGWRFPFAVERVFQGDGRTEVSLGAEGSLGPGDIRVGTTLGRRVELLADLRYRFRERLALGIGYSLYDARNLRGERLIPSLKDGPTYQELSFRVSFLY